MKIKQGEFIYCKELNEVYEHRDYSLNTIRPICVNLNHTHVVITKQVYINWVINNKKLIK